MAANLEQTYRTKGMQRGALGHISMTLSGTLTVDDKGWSLDGGLGRKTIFTILTQRLGENEA